MTEVALALEDLWFWYEEDTPVLRGVDLSVARGQFLVLVGANGSGKTTLIKHLNGLLRPRRGQVRVDGQEVGLRPVGDLARHVAFLYQDPEQQIFSSTVRQELAFGPRNLGLSPEEVDALVKESLARFDLTPVADQPPSILGYGLRRRVTLASLASMNTPVLVLDEPTVGLDAHGRGETMGWLMELHAAGRTIILVTHDMALAAEHAERIIVLYQGQIIADGTPSDLFQEADLLTRASLTPPPVTTLAQALQACGLRGNILTVDTFCEEYARLVEERA